MTTRTPGNPWRKAAAAVLALAGLACAPAAQAELWGYIDADGVAHFADQKLDARYKLFMKDGGKLDSARLAAIQRGKAPVGADGADDIDLEQHKIGELVEWGPGPSGFGTYVAKDAPVAVASSGGGGGGGGTADRRARIALYDLQTGKKLREMLEEFRPRQSLAGISADGSKIYVGGAGSDFQVYDSATMQKIKTVELGHEIQGPIYVLDG